jgi:hypothetical protein
MDDWWTKAYVTVTGLGVYPAEVARVQWNGWACPRFTRQTAENIVADVAENNTKPWHDCDDRLSWDGDVIVRYEPAFADEEGYQPERLEPDSNGMYGIGAFEWVWQEAWCQGEIHEGEPDDLVTPVAVITVEPDEDGPGSETKHLTYCASCLDQARAAHPGAPVSMLPPL